VGEGVGLSVGVVLAEGDAPDETVGVGLRLGVGVLERMGGCAPLCEGGRMVHTPLVRVGLGAPEGPPPPATHGRSDTPWNAVPTGAVTMVVSEGALYTMRDRVGEQADRGLSGHVWLNTTLPRAPPSAP